MTLVIENVKEEFLSDFRKVAKNANATITQEIDECPICKAYDYTLKPEVEKEILEGIKELEQERKNGTLKTYSSVEDLMKALES